MVGSGSSGFMDIVDDHDAVGSDHGRRWCVDFTWRLNLVPFGGRDKGRLRRSQARKGRPLHIAEIYKEQKPFKETITNWYIFTTLTPLLTSACYNLQKSIQLLISNASSVSRLCQPLAHTFQGQEGTTVPRVCWNVKGEELEFGKRIEDFVKDFFPHLFLFLSNHFNGKLCSLEALLLNKTVLWCPVRAFGPVFESTGTNLKWSQDDVLLESLKR